MLLFTFERIAANQLAKRIGLMRGAPYIRAHLIQLDMRAGSGRLKSRFAPCQTRADDSNCVQTLVYRLKKTPDQLFSHSSKQIFSIYLTAMLCIIWRHVLVWRSHFCFRLTLV